MTATSISFGPYSASVLVDGERLPCYKIERNDALRETSCWVESQAGKPFSIEQSVAEAGHPFATTTFRVVLDGTFQGGFLSRPGSSQLRIGRDFGQDRTEPFEFSKLSTTDDDDEATTDENFIKGLGSIKLNLHEVIKRGVGTGQMAASSSGSRTVHEKSKKAAISEMTKLGAPISTGKAHNWVKLDYMDPIEKPYHTLTFHYRSRALLEVQGIDLPPLPNEQADEATPDRSPSPVAEPKKEKKPTVKRPSETVVISDDEDDVKPRLPKKRKSDQPPEVVVID